MTDDGNEEVVIGVKKMIDTADPTNSKDDNHDHDNNNIIVPSLSPMAVADPPTSPGSRRGRLLAANAATIDAETTTAELDMEIKQAETTSMMNEMTKEFIQSLSIANDNTTTSSPPSKPIPTPSGGVEVQLTIAIAIITTTNNNHDVNM